MKKILITLLLSLLISLFSFPAHAAQFSLTGGFVNYGFDADLEFKLSPRTSLFCDYTTTGPLLDDADVHGYNLGVKWYFSGESLNGTFAGISWGEATPNNCDIGGVTPITDGPMGYIQAVVGYRKITETGFTWELGGRLLSFNRNVTSNDLLYIGATALFGYTW